MNTAVTKTIKAKANNEINKPFLLFFLTGGINCCGGGEIGTGGDGVTGAGGGRITWGGEGGVTCEGGGESGIFWFSFCK
ncbi:MAG: hypothetical protein NTV87_05665 [Ignavibacteriae bacterium]|nr:hypothetical protein [Ignavibacteriota bacterium]